MGGYQPSLFLLWPSIDDLTANDRHEYFSLQNLIFWYCHEVVCENGEVCQLPGLDGTLD